MTEQTDLDGAPWRDRRHVDVRGRRMAYVDTGGDGPVVLVVHGLPTSSAEWEGVVAELGADVRTVVPDLPGFGGSDPAADHRLQTLTRHLTDFVRQVLGDDQPVHLALHDIGGVIGLAWAARNLVRVASITLLNTTTFPWQFVPPPPALVGVLGGASAVERLLTRRLFVAGLEATYISPVAEGTAAAHWRTYEVDEAKRRALAEVFAGYRHVVGLLREVNLALPSMQMPVNVVWGAADPFCKLRSAVTFAERMPSARLRVLAGVGHFVPQEAPGDVAHEIRGAIARAAARTRG
jgi:pimeloyl-ACP methyl ester carboxylesterase